MLSGSGRLRAPACGNDCFPPETKGLSVLYFESCVLVSLSCYLDVMCFACKGAAFWFIKKEVVWLSNLPMVFHFGCVALVALMCTGNLLHQRTCWQIGFEKALRTCCFLLWPFRGQNQNAQTSRTKNFESSESCDVDNCLVMDDVGIIQKGCTPLPYATWSAQVSISS